MQPAEYETLRAQEDHYWWYAVLHWLVLRVLKPRTAPGARVLDAGCGTGGMLSRLDGWQVDGIDRSERAVELCRQRGLTTTCHGCVQALPWERATFDVVLSLDVLYHAQVDDELALHEMLRVLRPGGLLVLNLHAYDCLRGSHDVAVCGARRYRACHVRQWLEYHSLEAVMIHYWNAWLFLPLLAKRWFHRSATSDLGALPCWLNEWLTVLGKADATLCRWLRLPWGSSVFAVIRKPSTARSHE